MRRRAARMILTAVAVVALIFGIPAAVASSLIVWNTQTASLDTRAQTVQTNLDRRLRTSTLSEGYARMWAQTLVTNGEPAYVEIMIPQNPQPITLGEPLRGITITRSASSPDGVKVTVMISARNAIRSIVRVSGIFLLGILVSLAVGWALAARFSRRLSAPLIYLSAQAEQIGSGQVRARVKPSGIEEIDLVQEELQRTGEKMARRLAAERQLAADASHQLRTPLTALSMRLEEIEMISTEEEVQEEARSCLEQVERLTAVVTELLDTNKRQAAATEAIDVLEVFNTQREEWEEAFEKTDRVLRFTDEADMPILADEAKIATVLEQPGYTRAIALIVEASSLRSPTKAKASMLNWPPIFSKMGCRVTVPAELVWPWRRTSLKRWVAALSLLRRCRQFSLSLWQRFPLAMTQGA